MDFVRTLWLRIADQDPFTLYALAVCTIVGVIAVAGGLVGLVVSLNG